MKKFLKWTVIILLIGMVIIQFIRIDKSVPEYDKSGDFTAVNSQDAEGIKLLKNACYDCHSYESKYPWYSNIAPVSWMVGHHIEEGREHLNFSLWTSYSVEDKAEIIEESCEEIQEGEMPMSGYVRMHAEADLSEQDKQVLITYLKSAAVGNPSMQSGGEDEQDED